MTGEKGSKHLLRRGNQNTQAVDIVSKIKNLIIPISKYMPAIYSLNYLAKELFLGSNS